MQTQSVTTATRTNSLWLRPPAWDLSWISLSGLLMVVPYASYGIGKAIGLDADNARNVVNVIVAFLIGGPHMYATHTRSTFDPTFRSKHKSIAIAAIVIPSFVIFMGVQYFQLLLTFFFFWASIHVLHQIIFLVDCYNGRQTRTQSKRSIMIDYAVVLTALYPMAMYRFVKGTFQVGPNLLWFPPFLHNVDLVWWIATAMFSTSLALYLAKTVKEFRTGSGNIPKTILISMTVIATFITPFFHELDVSFQGLNTWHSFQYLGLTWYINRLRYERGERQAGPVSKLSGPGSWYKYYGFNLAMTIATLGIWGTLMFTRSYTGLSFDQTYYITILCFLLTHYYHDHILFREPPNFGVSEETLLSGSEAYSVQPV